MELISEEELSVCRSEGSPPRKKKQRRKTAENNAVVDMNNSQAQAVLKYKGSLAAAGHNTKGVSVTTTTTAKKLAS